MLPDDDDITSPLRQSLAQSKIEDGMKCCVHVILSTVSSWQGTSEDSQVRHREAQCPWPSLLVTSRCVFQDNVNEIIKDYAAWLQILFADDNGAVTEMTKTGKMDINGSS